MVPEIENNLPEIVRFCRRMDIKSLYLVGSAARGHDYTQISDIDFLYSMLPEESETQKNGGDFFDLLWGLEKITGRKVDLIAEDRIRNKYLLRSLADDKVKIYEA